MRRRDTPESAVGSRARVLALLASTLMLATLFACVPAPPGGGSGSGCTRNVAANVVAVRQALASAAPGQTLCIAAGNLGSAVLSITRSGRADALITVRGANTRVAGIDVTANHVIVTGFEVAGGPGISMEGTGLRATSNNVHDTTTHGITCDVCTHSQIRSNWVARADGSGILVSGTSVLVEANVVRDSRQIRGNDADGIRFFGANHVLRRNHIADILEAASPGKSPHTDCFQTFDNGGKLPTRDVIIDSNLCQNVDHQCLIASAEEAFNAGQFGRSRNIRFTNNICANNGSQGIFSQWFPGLFIVNNAFMGRVFRGAYLLDSSTGATFTNNVLIGRMRAYETDASSASGFSAAANMQDQVFTPQPAGVSYGPLGLASPTAANLETRLMPSASSRLLDAAVPFNQVPRDRFGVARPQPKRAGFPARPDVGPIERVG